MILYLVIAAVIIVLDQIVKYMTVEYIPLGNIVNLHNPILSLTYIKNTGAAWGILAGKMWLFTLITVVVVAGIIYVLYKNRNASKWFSIGLSLILGGAIGNFIDRIGQGFVVDMFMFKFIDFPIFNVADISLVMGVGCIIVWLIMDELNERKKKKVVK